MPNPAAVAYEAYRKYLNGKAHFSHYLIPWHLLSAHEQKAWFEVVGAVTNLLRPNATQEAIK